MSIGDIASVGRNIPSNSCTSFMHTRRVCKSYDGGLAPVEVFNRNRKQFQKWKLKKRLVTTWTFHK